jgi:hypothetical protein
MRKLRADEIECRVAQVSSKGCSLLLYKTARVDRAILDEEFGAMNWQNDFKVIDGKMYGYISVYDNGKKEWVTKSDCGTESNTEAEKGQASDCFKRAGFKWGIGVELYTAPFIWLNVATVKDEFASKRAGKDVYKLADKFAKYAVKSIDYNNDCISDLVIVDDKGNAVYFMGKKENNFTQKKLNDSSIYISLAKLTDLDLIKNFYEENKDKVNEPEKLRKTAREQYKAISDAKKMFEGVENG